MLIDQTSPTAEEFAEATGWTIKAEGACSGDVCVPLGGGAFDAEQTASRLGMAVVSSSDGSRRAFGPASLSGRALASAVAPELVLPDHRGSTFRLSSLRGQKVLLVAWAPY